MDRRAFLGVLGGAIATATAAMALGRRGSDGPVLRIGVMSNLTHAPLLAGLGSGRIAAALAPIRIETRIFRAGPRVTEALIGDAIDIGTAGPAPIVVHHARHTSGGGRGLRVVSGCSSGGASLVVTKASGIRGPEDLHRKRLAVAQIGTTQDVALRTYLRAHDLRDATAGGDVSVLAIAPSTILAQMIVGDLDGAWLAEPWATRLVREIDATRLVDERDLWPERRFATALLATRQGRENEEPIKRLVVALNDEIERANHEPKNTRDDAYAELKRRIGNPGARAVFEDAAKYVDFTADPLRATVERFATDAAALELCPPGGTAGLFG